jgi:hypothetical protein
MAAGAHIPLRFLRAAMKKGISLLKARIPTAQSTAKVLEPVYTKAPRNAHLHPALRQKVGGRWYTTTVKNLLRFTADSAPKAAHGGSSIRNAVDGKLRTTSPFASTLRPTLTGGAFPRTAGGYSIGGSARFFSHGPAAPAQVMQQVSCAMRAFINSGKGQMDSYRRHDGKMGRVGVRAQLAASLAQENAPGAYIDFDLSPTMTCISPLNASKCTLENEDFLEGLAADFGSMMGSLVAINADIRRLSMLGDLPVSLVGPNHDTLRVHFRGCDREFVERICDEFGVCRGVVHEDERFAFGMLAPGCDSLDWKEMRSASPPSSSAYSEDGFEDEYISDGNECIRSRVTGSDYQSEDYYFDPADQPVVVPSPGYSSSGGSSNKGYGGLEGIHRFLEECDEYRSGLSAWR